MPRSLVGWARRGRLANALLTAAIALALAACGRAAPLQVKNTVELQAALSAPSPSSTPASNPSSSPPNLAPLVAGTTGLPGTFPSVTSGVLPTVTPTASLLVLPDPPTATPRLMPTRAKPPTGSGLPAPTQAARPPRATPTELPQTARPPRATPTELPQAVCVDPRVQITRPRVGEVVRVFVPIHGTAIHARFSYWKLEYARGTAPKDEDYDLIRGWQRRRIDDGTLAGWDIRGLDPGPYTIRLTVVDETGNYPPPCTVVVEVEK